MNLSRSPLSRRSALTLVAGAAAVPIVAGCQSDPSADPSTAASGSAGSNGAFPVTIKHALGSTTIPSAPQRVVTVGYTDHEMFLALGNKPVGVRPWFGEKIDHTWPWVAPLWGDTTPTYIGAEINFEKIAGLKPDVIVGLYAEITKDEYAKLSAIAPTVAQDPDSAPYTTDRATMFTTAAKVMGKVQQGEQKLAEIKSGFQKARNEHPEFAGKTAAVIDPSQNGFYAFSSSDPRGRFLGDLGFAAPKGLDRAIGDKFGDEISAERADLLDIDRLLLLADAKSRRWLAKSKIFQQLDVTKDGRTLEIPYYEKPHAGAAMAYDSVLSVPYAVQNLVPQLAKITG